MTSVFDVGRALGLITVTPGRCDVNCEMH